MHRESPKMQVGGGGAKVVKFCLDRNTLYMCKCCLQIDFFPKVAQGPGLL